MSTQSALQAIYDEHNALTPALVVAAAVDPEHELHERFEWDDTEAARRFRLAQAGQIIRTVSVRVDRGEDVKPIQVRAFIAARDAGVSPAGDETGDETGEYLPVQEVVASDIRRAAWFRTLTRDWQALKRRAGESREFAQMVLDDLRDATA